MWVAECSKVLHDRASSCSEMGRSSQSTFALARAGFRSIEKDLQGPNASSNTLDRLARRVSTKYRMEYLQNQKQLITQAVRCMFGKAHGCTARGFACFLVSVQRPFEQYSTHISKGGDNRSSLGPRILDRQWHSIRRRENACQRSRPQESYATTQRRKYARVPRSRREFES